MTLDTYRGYSCSANVEENLRSYSNFIFLKEPRNWSSVVSHVRYFYCHSFVGGDSECSIGLGTCTDVRFHVYKANLCMKQYDASYLLDYSRIGWFMTTGYLCVLWASGGLPVCSVPVTSSLVWPFVRYSKVGWTAFFTFRFLFITNGSLCEHCG